MIAAMHLSMLVASLARPVDPYTHGMFFQLNFRLTLSLMRVPSALIFPHVLQYGDILAGELLRLM